MALDAIEGDPEFLSRACDCRAMLQAQREQRRARAESSASKHGATSVVSGPLSPSRDASEDGDADDGEEAALQGVIEEEDNATTEEENAFTTFQPLGAAESENFTEAFITAGEEPT
jgi:hypothetical protein